MRTRNSPDEQARFKGQIRHYHRGGPKAKRSWDEWIGGRFANSRDFTTGQKVLAITVAILLIVGIVVGLIIKLR